MERDTVRSANQRRGVKGANVLALAAAHERDVADTRESAALTPISTLQNGGVRVVHNDLGRPGIHVAGTLLAPVRIALAVTCARDPMVGLADHRAVHTSSIVRRAKSVADERNATGSRRTVSSAPIDFSTSKMSTRRARLLDALQSKGEAAR